MGSESTQHKLDRTRKPRVQITYDVEIGDAQEVKELPFVLGVMADLSGSRDPENPLPKLKDRGFVEVDRDNFNDFLKKQTPRLAFKVDDKLSGDKDAQLGVDLRFKSMKDFEPEGVINQIPALKELLEVRKRLKSLQSRVTSSDEVTDFLREILSDDGKRKAIADELGIGGGDGGGDAAPAGDDPGEPPAGDAPAGDAPSGDGTAG
ncbi:MAG: type VI secretion system contractile sheath small subunit [Planctomycetes bacterium]|nr:type VI secretion system contractile sheath small subunit [Planctomycetota bacterium]